MTQHLKLFLLIILTVLLSACSQAQKKSNTKNTDSGRTLKYERTISFLSAEGDTVSTVEVAVADDAEKRNQGLMDVRELPKSKGMLFIFDDNEERSFWMANTPLALDIFFVNADEEIVRIHHNAEPFSEKNFLSEKPAQYVIETNGGYAISHDIQEGMKVSL